MGYGSCVPRDNPTPSTREGDGNPRGEAMHTLMEDTRTVDGIVFTIRVVATDEQPDLSWLGEFTDLTADQHGCGKRHVRASYDSREYAYFCPAMGCDPRSWKEIAAENGWTKDQFFEAAQKDMEIAREWIDCGVMVTADLGPAGEAESSLWGLDWMNDEDYITKDVVDECVREVEAYAEHLLYRRVLGGRISAHSGIDHVNWEVA